MQRTAGSAVFTAAIRSAVNVAIPHRRGTAEATKAIRTRPFCGATANSVGNATLGGETGDRPPSRAEQDVCPRLGLPRYRKARATPRGEATAHIRDVAT